MPANTGDNIPKLTGRYINIDCPIVHLIAIRSIIRLLERSLLMSQAPNQELLVLLGSFLIETIIRLDLTEILRPYTKYIR